MTTEKKSVLVLARNDHAEAMRVAAGLTIFGHQVRLIFMSRPVSEADAEGEQAELLELSEIVPETTVAEMRDALSFLDAATLGAAISASDAVVNI
ncbi:MAG: hypothetical protein ACR2PO_00740 [Methyloligellaceae bacterium]